MELIVMFVLLALIGATVAAVLRAPRDRAQGRGSIEQEDRARRILDERYARGELSRDEYRRMRQDIEEV